MNEGENAQELIKTYLVQMMFIKSSQFVWLTLITRGTTVGQKQKQIFIHRRDEKVNKKLQLIG